MKDLIFIPLGYFVIVATLGLAMRLMPFIDNFPLAFENIRHAHSHVAFLGWVCSAYFLLIFQNYFASNKLFIQRSRPIYLIIQVITVALTVTFLLSGYSTASIVLLSVHSALLYGLIIYTLSELKNVQGVSVDRIYLIAALLFFCLSTLAPFCMPILIALDIYTLENKNLLVQTFLHFQIHGWFVFGLLSLVLRKFDSNALKKYKKEFQFIFLLLIIGIISTFIFTVIEAKGDLSNLLSFGRIGSILQLLGFCLFFRSHLKISNSNLKIKDRFQNIISSNILIVLILKSSFEILRGFDSVIPIYLSNHFLIIAFLHLILLGGISLFIIDRIKLDFHLIDRKSSYRWMVAIFYLGFLFTEITLVGFGLNVELFQHYFHELVVIGALLLFLSAISFYKTMVRFN